MIQDSKQHKFEIVVVWKLDRFSRDRYDSAYYKHELKKNGVRMISAMEPISSDPEGVILESLLEGKAEYYSLNLAENVKRGIRESVLQQNFTGGMVPFGYYVENKKLKVREELIPVVREIYQMYKDGEGKKEIVKKLELRGIKTNYGKPVSITSLERILSNKKYIGQVEVGDMNYCDESLRMISDELYYSVQNKLHANYKRRGEKKAIVHYLLSGKCYCGYCGAAMVGECGKSRNGEIHNYYACRDKKRTIPAIRKTSKKKR